MAITPDGTRVYVTGSFTNSVSVIDNTSTLPTLLSGPGLPILVGAFPTGVAITQDGAHAYVTNLFDNSVSVIDTGLNAVVATTPVVVNPVAVAATQQGQKA